MKFLKRILLGLSFLMIMVGCSDSKKDKEPTKVDEETANEFVDADKAIKDREAKEEATNTAEEPAESQ